MDLNHVYSKSLRKMLNRKLLYNCDLSKLQSSPFQNPQSKPSRSKSQKSRSQQKSPQQTQLKEFIEKDKPKGLSKQIDSIMRVLTEGQENQFTKNSIGRRKVFSNYRIVTESQSKQTSAKHTSRDLSSVRFPKITEKIADEVAFEQNKPRTRLYVETRRHHISERVGSETNFIDIWKVTRHYREGLTSLKKLNGKLPI